MSGPQHCWPNRGTLAQGVWGAVLSGHGATRCKLVVCAAGGLKDTSVQTCPATLSWDNPPGGLSILTSARFALNEFWYLESPETNGPQGLTTQGPGIRSEYDGTGAHFYCHEGKWLVQQFH